MLTLRAAAFYIGYSTATILWGALGAMVGPLLPYRTRFNFIVGRWTGFCLWWLRVTCGISHRVTGLEHVPEEACIVLCRHESTWETLFLQQLFAPQATLIKRELLNIPFFGWAFRTLRPIAIDRSQPRKALRTLVDEGTQRLQVGTWVVLFPEGTRMPPGELGRFQPGGAALAAASGYDVLVVAHNAGAFWPAHRFLKRPGVIDVRIAPPIPSSGRTSKAIQTEAAAVFEREMGQLTDPGPA